MICNDSKLCITDNMYVNFGNIDVVRYLNELSYSFFSDYYNCFMKYDKLKELDFCLYGLE